MLRKLISLLIATMFCMVVQAQNADNPKRTVSHNQDFQLMRTIAVTAPAYQKAAKTEIEALIIENGGAIETNFFNKLLNAPKIIIRQTKQIVGARGDNALKIDVTDKKTTIFYTTELSLQRALEILKLQVAYRHGASVIAGIDVIDWVDIESYAPKRPRAGDLDLTAGTSLLPRSQIESIIGRTKRGATLEIAVVTPQGWVIETTPLEGINPACKIYSPIGYYSLAHLKSLNDFAARGGVELVLKTNILESNERFLATTGFQMNSVEGMRFVRAMFTQWTAQTGVTTFVIGPQNAQIDARYKEFLDFIQKMLNIKFIQE